MVSVEHWNPEQDGPLTEPALQRKLQLRGFHVTRHVYSPGTYFPDHTHGVDKSDAVVSGPFRMTTPDGSAGDCLAVCRAAHRTARRS
jgi:hypothetical protein